MQKVRGSSPRRSTTPSRAIWTATVRVAYHGRLMARIKVHDQRSHGLLGLTGVAGA